ncbi:hemerythrin domain-containing protein [Nocardioides mesophilus]|uniref:Hemerythrin domain-containing protein n=1 Tax=Nocardioides mesophilus TaxID=433659 RepID=A0A7G9REP7_9ACTN|nr:hemerythrin domain-containing protein [Nocardioides mesophilus]QNN54072.1 hemerythrin domain-containing protein [Nocardioides mesophilus]
MDEHLALLELAGDVRRKLAAGDRAAAVRILELVGRQLDRHVGREERGIFAALKADGEFAEAVVELEDEHVSFDRQLAAIDPDRAGFGDRVDALLAELSLHIDKENLGIFPVAAVTLGATGWETVGRAHDAEPSFLSGSD